MDASVIPAYAGVRDLDLFKTHRHIYADSTALGALTYRHVSVPTS